ncbi:peptide ABC transporter substrate-binding protein [Candidatus Cryosericum septentrionale]|jgi:oligopeptide transport system substrate-binding protein|uniref:Peptide ABC transporter substrate-binding protein n=1 Tax=Candidatus Cryosericum septentrionale TaxID=2290913 RepID=A0A398DW94_9BACT|nr:peptide ABC transporter substrate-binding protein [Candidatus Cryosericum septentrionale]RIE16408.1 peptide ABC transporter substrate-binding protein [Candidatus Cryosericum septentrionale]
MKKVLSLVLVLLFVVSIFGGLSAVPSAKAVAQEVTYNLGAEPPGIDPGITIGVPEATIEMQVFDGLTRLDNKNVPQPAIAKSWTISKDGKTYIFTLRGAYWTNGTPVTAYDFEYAWKRVLNPELAAEYATQLYYVYGGQAFNKSIKVGTKYYVQAVDAKGNPLTKKVGGKDVPVANMAKEIDPSKNVGVKALNAKTLKVYLQSPTAYFLALTAFNTLYPVCKAVVSTNDKWASDVKTYVTDGPFKLTQWSHNDKMVFIKNPTYWDKDTVKLTKITFLMVEDSSTALSMYESGQLDSAADVPSSELPKLVASGDVKILPMLATYLYMFNVTKKPFNDVRVRKALTLAINRHQITTSITKGGQVPALGMVSNGIPDALPGSDFRTVGGPYFKDNDIATAKSLLAQAGYPNGKGFPAFSLLYNTSDLHKSVAEAIQQMWKKNLGITCTLRSEEWGVYLADEASLNYDVVRRAPTADYMDPNTFLELWVTGNGRNMTGYSNKAYDTLIAKEKATVDPKARMTVLHAAEKILMTDMPIAPVYFYTNPMLLSKHIKNFYESALGIVDWKNVYMG